MTTTPIHDRSGASLNTLFQSLATDRRREIVRLVADRSRIAKDELAAEIAAITADTRPTAVSADTRKNVQLSLVHCDLPALITAGLLVETEDGAVVTTDHWIVDDSEVETVLARRPPDELDAVFKALANSRRRTALSVLGDRSDPLSVSTLARDVAVREGDSHVGSVPDSHVDQVHTSLVHVHLPLLNDAGLIAYDDTAGRVAYEGHPVLRTEWIGYDHDSSTNDDTPSDAVTTFPGIAQFSG